MKKLLSFVLAMTFILSGCVVAFAEYDDPAEAEKYRYTVAYLNGWNKETQSADFTIAKNALFLYDNKLIDINSERYDIALSLFDSHLKGHAVYTLADNNKPNFKYGASMLSLHYYSQPYNESSGSVIIYNDGTVKEYNSKTYIVNKFFRVSFGENLEVAYSYDGKVVSPPDEAWYVAQVIFGDNYKENIRYEEANWPEEYKTLEDNEPSIDSEPDPDPQDDTPDSQSWFGSFLKSFASIWTYIIKFFQSVIRFFSNLF